MIPKIIHYCWFGRGLMPKSQKDCIRGWKRLMPDYTFMRWDETTFPLEKYPLAKYACEAKRYALASDVCRYNVLAEYGGIYLDTDVELFQRLDTFLSCNFFSAIELYKEFYSEHIQERFLFPNGTIKNPSEDIPRFEILTSILGCCPQNQLIIQLRDYYNSAEATFDRALNYRDWVNNDRLVARYLAQYGFRYRNETQYLQDNMVVYGTGIFGYAFSPDPKYEVSFHHNAATWESEKWSRTKRHEMFFDKIGLLKPYHTYKKFKRRVKAFLLHPKQGEVWCLHRVTPNRSAFPSNRELEITPDFLENLIAQKIRTGFRFVPLEQIVNGHSYLNRKQIHISFDDGFKDVYEYAFPILMREQIPFTIFLTTGMPEGTAHLWWLQLEKLAKNADDFESLIREIYDSGKNMSQYFCEKFGVQPDDSLTHQYSLSWAQIKEMMASGLCTIGSHTNSHPALTRIGEDNIISELETSKRIIENKLSVTPTYFSYPHSMENAAIQESVERVGYSHAFTVSGGGIRTNHNPYCLNRINIVQS